MSHNHEHHHSSTKNIKVAFWLNLSFSIIEFIGGIFTNSVAIISDALHDLGDSFSLLLAWYFQKVSLRKRDTKYSYGYKRFALIGALINSAILLVGSAFILFESIQRLASPQQPDAKGMLLLAIAGIIINGLAVFRLKKGHSINEKVVSLHLLEDVLGWVAVLIGSVIMMLVDAPIIDPILSIGIALFILFNIYKNIRSSLIVFLQGTPENIDAQKIKEAIKTTAHVIDLHDFHTWTMDGEYNILTVHVVIDSTIASLKETQLFRSQLKEKLYQLNIHHATIEIEYSDSPCDGDC
jgi:cobalt-zinc-cadmium efflux system protein